MEALKTDLIHISDCFLKLAREQRDKDQQASYNAFRISDTCRKAAENLRTETAEVELEGGGSTWWYVCEECRKAVDTSDKYCRECGRKLKWEGYLYENH